MVNFVDCLKRIFIIIILKVIEDNIFVCYRYGISYRPQLSFGIKFGFNLIYHVFCSILFLSSFFYAFLHFVMLVLYHRDAFFYEFRAVYFYYSNSKFATDL